MQALTAKLQSQTLADPTFYTPTDASKIRHHSEPAEHFSYSSGRDRVISLHDNKVSAILLGANQDFTQRCSESTQDGWLEGEVDPPIKRQCRSQSIPGDGRLHSQWLQSQNARKLHRPLPVRPHSGGSRGKSTFSQHVRNSRHYGQQNKAVSHNWSLTPTTEFYHTPPESPVPRPSSASSGFYDSPLASLSNLNKQHYDSLQQLPLVASTVSLNSAKSMPSVAALTASVPSSPKRHRIPRCRSQPCVMNERRAIKRRRDDDHNRPCLNFHKMTETAYGSTENLGRVRSSPLNVKSFSSHTSVFGKAFQERVLQTIASSPQDSSLSSSPQIIQHLSTSPQSDANANLSSTPINDCASDSGCSTSDEDVCEKFKNDDSLDVLVNQEGCEEPRDCDYLDASDAMFPMDAINSELDLDMIEND